jgi:hypothetical protein
MLNRFTQLKKIRIINSNHLFTQKTPFSNKDKKKNDNLIHYTFATIGGTIGTIRGLQTSKTMCGHEFSDKAGYVILMGFMGTGIGYISFIMFPILVPLGLVTAVLIENLDDSKKDK